jgi:isopentenyldiphosphate isomerase
MRPASRPPTDPGDELAVLVDGDDRVVGHATRREVRRRKLLHRGVAVLCRNPAGEIYVHRRTDTKDVFPGLYDMFVGGMVTAGESYSSCARRELAEELGIAGPRPRLLFKHRYRGHANPTWTAVFEVVWDGPIRHQPEEVAWGAYLSEGELLAKLEGSGAPGTGAPENRLERWPFVPDGLEIYRRYLDERAAATARRSRPR